MASQADVRPEQIVRQMLQQAQAEFVQLQVMRVGHLSNTELALLRGYLVVDPERTIPDTADAFSGAYRNYQAQARARSSTGTLVIGLDRRELAREPGAAWERPICVHADTRWGGRLYMVIDLSTGETVSIRELGADGSDRLIVLRTDAGKRIEHSPDLDTLRLLFRARAACLPAMLAADDFFLHVQAGPGWRDLYTMAEQEYWRTDDELPSQDLDKQALRAQRYLQRQRGEGLEGVEGVLIGRLLSEVLHISPDTRARLQQVEQGTGSVPTELFQHSALSWQVSTTGTNELGERLLVCTPDLAATIKQIWSLAHSPELQGSALADLTSLGIAVLDRDTEQVVAEVLVDTVTGYVRQMRIVDAEGSGQAWDIAIHLPAGRLQVVGEQIRTQRWTPLRQSRFAQVSPPLARQIVLTIRRCELGSRE